MAGLISACPAGTPSRTTAKMWVTARPQIQNFFIFLLHTRCRSFTLLPAGEIRDGTKMLSSLSAPLRGPIARRLVNWTQRSQDKGSGLHRDFVHTVEMVANSMVPVHPPSDIEHPTSGPVHPPSAIDEVGCWKWDIGCEKIRMRASRFTSAIHHPPSHIGFGPWSETASATIGA